MDKQAVQLHGQRLLEAGISRKVVKRYLKEIDAHYEDLLTQARYQGLTDAKAIDWATQKLGSEEQLLQSMKDRPELRSWAHRHPWMSTLLLPTILYILSIAAVFLLGMALVALFGPADSSTITASSVPQWLPVVISSSVWFLTYGLTPVLAFAVIVWTNRHYLLPVHQIAGVLLICVLGSGMSLTLELPDPIHHRQGVAGVSFGYAWDEQSSWEAAFHTGKKLRLASNLALCGGLIWLLRQRKALRAG